MTAGTRRHVTSRLVQLMVALLVAVSLQSVPLAGPATAAVAVELVRNGGFEDVQGVGFNKQGVASVGPGSSLPGWRVSNGSVDVARSLPRGPWSAFEGTHSVDLNGQNPGTLSQTLSVTPGARYVVSLQGAVNPSCTFTTANVHLRWAGATVKTFTVTRSGTPAAVGWQKLTTEVTATGTSAALDLASAVQGSCGPVVDAVSVTRVLPPAPVPTALSAVDLRVDAATTGPGAGEVPVGDIPLDQVSAASLGALVSAPLRSVPLRSVPLRSVPLRSVPLRSVPLASVPLRSVTLNQVPLVGDVTWLEILKGTELDGRPLQDVTLAEVLDPGLELVAASIARLDLGQLDLSASPLRSVSLTSIYLGGAAIKDLPIGANQATGDLSGAYNDWCAAVDRLSESTCASLSITPDSPVLALELAAIPLRSVPLRSVPLRSVPVAAPLRSVPLSSVPLRSVPLGEVPLRLVDGVDVAAVPKLASVSLDQLSAESRVRTDLVDSGVAATRTLGDLYAKGLLSPYDLADLGPYGGVAALAALTIGDIADAAALSVTLGAALLSLLDPRDIAWESIPVAELDLPRNDVDGALVRYTASFSLTGDGAARTGTVAVTLPPGFEYAENVITTLPLGSRTPVQDGQRLTWALPATLPSTTTTVSVAFDVRPPLALGAGIASLAVSLPAVGQEPALAGADTAAVQVVSRTAVDPAQAVLIQPDTLVVGHTPVSGRPGYLKIAVPPPGTRVSITLSQHTVDGDLVVYGEVNRTDTSPGSAPLRSVPLRSVPLTDPGVDAAAGLLAPTSIQEDVPRLPGLPLVGVSAQRGTAVEQVDTLSTGGGGAYTVQVSGYDGAFSDQPWVLRVRQVTPEQTTCPARSFPAQTGTTAPPANVTDSTRALFLLNEQQLRAEHGTAAADALVGDLEVFARRADVAGAVVRVDRSVAVASAYTAWNRKPCDIEVANAVVDAVSGLVVDYAGTYRGITSVTLVGGDQQVPFGRVPDLTAAVNERGFAPEATGVRADGSRFDNPYSAAAAAGYLLSDDPYGTLEALAWLDRELYVPQLAVGRLVETPAQISGQLAQFRTAGGVVDPTSALTTGYDFLTDGARAVDAALSRSLGPQARRTTLISDTWTRADLVAALGVRKASPPRIASVNAHFDPSRALPAAGNTTGDETDLFVTSDVVGTGSFRSSLLFSMGCHAGLSIPAGYSGIAGSPATADWPKAFATEGALWVANTGYGLGDTATVALSEELMAGFASRLDGTVTAGAALAWAKQDYVGSLGAYGSADEKVLQQIAFYGLPMWRIGGPPSTGGAGVTLPAAPPLPTVTPVASGLSGLSTVSTVLEPTFARTDAAGLGSFWSVAGETQTTAGLPVQPRTSRPLTPSTPQTAHGVLVTELRSRDVAGVDPRSARAVLAESANEPAQDAKGVSFPAGLASLTTSDTPVGRQTRLVVVPGQFLADPGEVRGTQRLFDRVGTTTYYSPTGAFVPPSFRTLNAERGLSSVTFSLEVDAAAGETVQRVLVMVRDGGAAQWKPLDLARVGTGALWQGTLPVNSRSVEWFAQALSSTGNVGISSNKGALFGSSADFVVEVAGTTGDNGFFTSDVVVTVDGPAARYTVSVDGGAPEQVFGSLLLTGDGRYDLVVRGSDGEVRELTVLIDRTAPIVTVVPVGGGTFQVGGSGAGVVVCLDGAEGSGLVGACGQPVTVSTASPGAVTAALSTLGLAPVADRAGNITTGYTYQVRYTFSGFQPPVDGDGINVVTAGSTVPLKFTLASATGAVLTRSAVESVASRQVPCGTGGPSGPPLPGISEPTSALRIKDGRYEYTWRTLEAWVGTCRVLEITLADDTVATATFDLR